MKLSSRLAFISALTALVLLLPLILPSGSVGLAEDLQAGVHYELILPPVPQPKGEKSVVEVFNFKCPHCFKLHPHMEAWAKSHQNSYRISSLPLFWGSQTDIPLRAYYAGEFLGKGAEMKRGIFKAYFKDSVNIESPDELDFLAEELGLNPEQFREYLNAFGVSAKIAQSKRQQQAFGVNSTPTLVVNGRYRVSYGQHAKGDPVTLFKIVEMLAAR
ncbi:MAG: thiol:disulfide interchange protein DsbA/DsbL [Magnetococcales bacterium]|nr:thiol:disulfide interchange protein DsbA/DsbL [Magnetococcales bacterium]